MTDRIERMIEQFAQEAEAAGLSIRTATMDLLLACAGVVARSIIFYDGNDAVACERNLQILTKIFMETARSTIQASLSEGADEDVVH